MATFCVLHDDVYRQRTLPGPYGQETVGPSKVRAAGLPGRLGQGCRLDCPLAQKHGPQLRVSPYSEFTGWSAGRWHRWAAEGPAGLQRCLLMQERGSSAGSGSLVGERPGCGTAEGDVCLGWTGWPPSALTDHRPVDAPR